MKRTLLRSNSFINAARKVLKKYPESAIDIMNALK